MFAGVTVILQEPGATERMQSEVSTLKGKDPDIRTHDSLVSIPRTGDKRQRPWLPTRGAKLVSCPVEPSLWLMLRLSSETNRTCRAQAWVLRLVPEQAA